MKRIVTTFALLAICAVPAFATTLVSESFTYPNGNLVPNGGWAVYSGTPPTDIQVVSGRAVGNHANAPDDHLLFPVQLATSVTYACFDVIINPSAVPAPAPKPVYFLELKDAGATLLVSRVYVLPTSAGWTFGISHSSTSATVGVTPWGASLNYGQKYNVVINYDPNNHTSTLWVDPVNSGSTNVTDTNAAATAVAVQGVGLRQSGTASTLPPSPAYVGTDNIIYSVDNLGVGTSFDDSCVQYRSTPTTTSTWSHVKAIYR